LAALARWDIKGAVQGPCEEIEAMPTYDYQCQKCDFEFEREQRITEDPIKTCPKCKSRKAKRLLSASNFILKGGGWYADGYGSSGGKSSADSDASAESSASSSKSESDSSDKPAEKKESKKAASDKSSSSKKTSSKSDKSAAG
jgi:putative FmdB family regulatory protein